jgi:hypothetical protein
MGPASAGPFAFACVSAASPQVVVDFAQARFPKANRRIGACAPFVAFRLAFRWRMAGEMAEKAFTIGSNDPFSHFEWLTMFQPLQRVGTGFKPGRTR